MGHPQFVLCDPELGNSHLYFDSDIQRAIVYGMRARIWSIYDYPKDFKNIEELNLQGCPGPQWEYPLFSGGTFGDPNYSPPLENGNPRGADAGDDRAIFDCAGRLCAVVTHRGMPKGKFQLCTYGPIGGNA